MNTKMKVVVDGNFLNYGGTILNRAEVAEADAPNGMVIMKSGHQYFLEPSVVCGWFSDTMDMAKLPVCKGGGESGKPDAPKKVWLVFHEEHEACGGTKTKVAHVCDSRLKAEELLESDGAFIANLKDSDIRSTCYKGSKGDFDYRYYIEEMEVQA